MLQKTIAKCLTGRDDDVLAAVCSRLCGEQCLPFDILYDIPLDKLSDVKLSFACR